MSAARRTSAQRNEYRLSDDDGQRIGRAVARWYADLHRTSGRGIATSQEVEAVRRLAAQAIGCTLADLRDSEIDRIDAEIAAQELGA
ncbi:MAG: hypothetical protein AB7G37_06375 [Solirubrobacteraceae bacterium]